MIYAYPLKQVPSHCHAGRGCVILITRVVKDLPPVRSGNIRLGNPHYMRSVPSRYRAKTLVVLGAVVYAAALFADPIETHGVTFKNEVYRDVPFTVAWIDREKAELELFWKDERGVPFVNFSRLDSWLQDRGKTLVVATNSGIYAEDRTPLGLHIAGGEELRALNPHKGGKGNFALKPNGVFYIDAAGAHIGTTEAYMEAMPKAQLAVQSGPMLVIDGVLHPKFNEESTSIHFRNGIGVLDEKHIALVISNLPVNFYTFASYFKDHLHCSNALYLDGSLSGIYAPAIDRTAPGLEYVGMLAVTTDRAPLSEGLVSDE